MIYTEYSKLSYDRHKVETKCPHCGIMATFTAIGEMPDINLHNMHYTGIRYCPSCKSFILFDTSLGSNGKFYVDMILPNHIQKTNIKNLPPKIEGLLNEALGCYSNNYYTAAGMLIRKTLEAICDEKQAKGDNLHQRINSLKKQVTIAESLYEAAMQLKLLGNDAAHIDLKDFDNIGKEELVLAFTLLERILKSIYEDGIYLEALIAKKKS